MAAVCSGILAFTAGGFAVVRPIAVVVALSLGSSAAAQERRLSPAGGERRSTLVVGNDSYAGVECW